MAYVRRDAEGRITSLHASNAPGCEAIDDDHAELAEFMSNVGTSGGKLDHFAQTDLDFVRVIEDVIYLLIERRVIVLTDLPVAAQRKLAQRRNQRDTTGDLGEILSMADDFELP